jgi:hypothetical protein
VCVRERERERERVCVCACVRESVCVCTNIATYITPPTLYLIVHPLTRNTSERRNTSRAHKSTTSEKRIAAGKPAEWFE